MEKIRVRFAPSPTGFLHVGNARTALFNWLFVRKMNGAFVLRIEDTDVERSRQEYELGLIEDLRWMGLDWDEGPDVGGPFGPYRQSERVRIYEDYTRKLLDSGKAYHCFCSVEELEKEREAALAAGKMPIYGGRCRSICLEEARHFIRQGRRASVRLMVPDLGRLCFEDLVRGGLEFDLKLIGDPILVRSNGLPAYNFAVVVDDSLMEITHVIRGEDHISNTPRQILLYQALGLEPPRFAHLAMVMGQDNARLSKRHGATAVDQFAKDGFLPTAFFNYLAILGWAPPEGREVLGKGELLELFDLRKVSRSAAVFDYEKLNWLDRQHFKRLSPEEKAHAAHPFLRDAGFMPAEPTAEQWRWLEKAVDSLLEGVDRLIDLPPKFGPLFDFDPAAADEESRAILGAKRAGDVIRAFGEKLDRSGPLDAAGYVAAIEEVKRETGLKGKALFHPIRVALTARSSGLELDRFVPLAEAGAGLDFPKRIPSCRERVKATLDYLGRA